MFLIKNYSWVYQVSVSPCGMFSGFTDTLNYSWVYQVSALEKMPCTEIIRLFLCILYVMVAWWATNNDHTSNYSRAWVWNRTPWKSRGNINSPQMAIGDQGVTSTPLWGTRGLHQLPSGDHWGPGGNINSPQRGHWGPGGNINSPQVAIGATSTPLRGSFQRTYNVLQQQNRNIQLVHAKYNKCSSCVLHVFILYVFLHVFILCSYMDSLGVCLTLLDLIVWSGIAILSNRCFFRSQKQDSCHFKNYSWGFCEPLWYV